MRSNHNRLEEIHELLLKAPSKSKSDYKDQSFIKEKTLIRQALQNSTVLSFEKGQSFFSNPDFRIYLNSLVTTSEQTSIDLDYFREEMESKEEKKPEVDVLPNPPLIITDEMLNLGAAAHSMYREILFAETNVLAFDHCHLGNPKIGDVFEQMLTMATRNSNIDTLKFEHCEIFSDSKFIEAPNWKRLINGINRNSHLRHLYCSGQPFGLDHINRDHINYESSFVKQHSSSVITNKNLYTFVATAQWGRILCSAQMNCQKIRLHFLENDVYGYKTPFPYSQIPLQTRILSLNNGMFQSLIAGKSWEMRLYGGSHFRELSQYLCAPRELRVLSLNMENSSFGYSGKPDINLWETNPSSDNWNFFAWLSSVLKDTQIEVFSISYANYYREDENLLKKDIATVNFKVMKEYQEEKIRYQTELKKYCFPSLEIPFYPYILDYLIKAPVRFIYNADPLALEKEFLPPLSPKPSHHLRALPLSKNVSVNEIKEELNKISFVSFTSSCNTFFMEIHRLVEKMQLACQDSRVKSILSSLAEKIVSQKEAIDIPTLLIHFEKVLGRLKEIKKSLKRVGFFSFPPDKSVIDLFIAFESKIKKRLTNPNEEVSWKTISLKF